MIDNIYETTIELIRKKTEFSSSFEEAAPLEMMRHLVELMGQQEWNQLIQPYLDSEEKFEHFFFRFHKQFRQTDCYQLEMSITLGEPKHLVEYDQWRTRAEEEDAYLVSYGKNKDRYKMVYRHHAGNLDMLFWELIHLSNKVELIMEHLWDMNEKGHKDFDAYSWCHDYMDFKRSKRKPRLTEEE